MNWHPVTAFWMEAAIGVGSSDPHRSFPSDDVPRTRRTNQVSRFDVLAKTLRVASKNFPGLVCAFFVAFTNRARQETSACNAGTTPTFASQISALAHRPAHCRREAF